MQNVSFSLEIEGSKRNILKYRLLFAPNVKPYWAKNTILVKASAHLFNLPFKPLSHIHCNRYTNSPRPKFITMAEVAEESQLGLKGISKFIQHTQEIYRLS